tara:strand:+ start:1923 stop:2144 length:222 start_codon:yes stop_codon:yes gene_type:complete
MASIQLIPCQSEFEEGADYILIPINDYSHLRIRKEYGTNEDGKRYEIIYVAHYKREISETSWAKVSQTSYVCF